MKFLLTILRTEYVYTNEGDALISDTMLLLIYLSFQVYIRIEISYDFQSKYIEIYIGIMTNKITYSNYFWSLNGFDFLKCAEVCMCHDDGLYIATGFVALHCPMLVILGIWDFLFASSITILEASYVFGIFWVISTMATFM